MGDFEKLKEKIAKVKEVTGKVELTTTSTSTQTVVKTTTETTTNQ